MDSNRIGPVYRADAPAKLNLFLEVLGKRPDGFHEIETLMVAVSLRDTLFFQENQEGTVQLSCNWAPGLLASAGGEAAAQTTLGNLPAPSATSDNTVGRALELLREAAGVDSGAFVHIVKRVPAAAGLGGASSDAGAALCLANVAWKVGWSRAQLSELAAEVGSDVPFFLADRKSVVARCTGRGEHIEGLRTAMPLHVVVIRPPVGLSTPEVYRQCLPAESPRSAEPLIAALKSGRLHEVGRRLFNRLEVAAATISPWIERLRQQIAKLGLPGQMSGSGSCFFVLCRHRRHAQRVAASLRSARVGQVFAASSVPPRCHLVAVSP